MLWTPAGHTIWTMMMMMMMMTNLVFGTGIESRLLAG
jgi:hypothetical protein